MVGVPGRSRGCLTCLSRKKGCDRQHPSCGQCVKAGLTCGGYNRSTVFVNRTQERGNIPVQYGVNASSAWGANPAPSAQDVTLPLSLTQTAYNSRYIDLFWSIYLPGGKAFSTDAARLSNGGWINVALDLYPSDRSLQLAMQCVALCGLGTRQRDRSLIEQGNMAYATCLQELNQALCNPRRVQQNELLCTVKLLSLFEMHYGSRDGNDQSQCQSWIAHAEGQLAIISGREPREFRSGKAHQLFVDYRYILVITSIRNRKRFPLNGKGWKTVPWKSITKTPRDRIMDILADLAGVLEDIDSLESCENGGAKTLLRKSITRTCWQLDEQLQSWIQDVGILKSFGDISDSEDVSGPRDIDDFALGHLTILYWATCVLLYSNLSAFIDQGVERPQRMDPAQYARQLAFALPFFLKPSAGIMGPKVASFPLGLTLQVLCGTEGSPSAHRNSLREFFHLQGESKPIAKFLMGLQQASGRAVISGPSDGVRGVEARAKSWMNLHGQT